jgi:hypothetical protein
METQEKILTPEESLQLIGQTIANYKRNYREEGFYFLLWGWITALASIIQFTAIKVLMAQHFYHLISTFSYLIWGGFIAAGIILQIHHINKRIITIASHLSRFIKILWQTNGIAIFIGLFLCYRFKVYPVPLILLLVGSATLTTGFVIKFKPLIAGGLAFYIFSVVASYYPNENQLLISALAIGLGYLIPGYMLKSTKE